MEATSPVTKQTVGRTFMVSLALLGVLAAVQLAAVFWVFISRYRANAEFDALETPALAAAAGATLSEEDLVAGRPLPATSPPPAAPAEEATGSSWVARPTPVPAVRAPTSTTEARLLEMVQQARGLRERGDTATALTRLREALAISPQSPLIISDLAITYEKMGQNDQAMALWQKIYTMGEAAGIYYSAAEAKIRATETEDAAAQEGTGIQPGSVLGLRDIVKTDLPDEASEAKLTLKIPLQAKPNVPIDVRDVVIQVYFYDIIDGKDVVQTNANVSSYWTTLPADWSDDDIEVLEVEYNQPKAEETAPAEKDADEAAPTETPLPAQLRKYFGYVVRVYYRNELQDMRAEPVSLLKDYPPPLTLQTE